MEVKPNLNETKLKVVGLRNTDFNQHFWGFLTSSTLCSLFNTKPMQMTLWTRWRKPWGERRHGPGTWPKAWRTCSRLCPHVSSSVALSSQTVDLERLRSQLVHFTLFHPCHSGNKRRQDTTAESRRISEGEQKKTVEPLFGFVHTVTTSRLCCAFAPRPTEEEPIGSHGPARGGKLTPCASRTQFGGCRLLAFPRVCLAGRRRRHRFQLRPQQQRRQQTNQGQLHH